MLHHDNAPAHTLLLVREFLVKQETCHPPDLAPADSPPKLKSTLKGRWFQTIEEIEENSLQDLHIIPQNAFQDTFQNWKERWKQCIDSGGEYFEGHKSY
jgi:hypothetical protein